jgi:natural product precursor
MGHKLKKLSLNRETLRDLTDQELRHVAGGDHTEASTLGCNCTGTCTGQNPRCRVPCLCQE